MATTNNGGQISYLILHSLIDGAKYGLEIIDIISKLTHGEIIIKKPSLYSALSRLEKRGLVESSYWDDSEQGGKRHYYSITNSGLREYDDLSNEFDLQQFIAGLDMQSTKKNETVTPSSKSDDGKLLSNDERIYADESEETQTPEPQISISSVVPNNQTVIMQSEEDEIKNQLQDEKKEESKPSKVYLRADSENYIDMSKYKKNKSYINSQLALDETSEEDKLEEIKRSIEDLKSKNLEQLESIKNQINSQSSKTDLNYAKEIQTNIAMQNTATEEKTPVKIEGLLETNTTISDEQLNNKEELINSQDKQEEQKDDGVLIDPSIRHEKQKTKPISPPDLDIKMYANAKKLPPPKRDENLEPSYREVVDKAQTRVNEYDDGTIEKVKSFSDYNELKQYYKQHNVKFNTYTKDKVEIVHNTNKIKMIVSFVLLAITSICMGLLYMIFALTEHTKSTTNFFYYVPVIIAGLYSLFTFIRNHYILGFKPMLKYNGLIMWLVAILASIVVVCINFICGMKITTFFDFSTTIFVPIVLLVIIFPVRYHITKFAYDKYGK